jgi:hypothetical protein
MISARVVTSMLVVMSAAAFASAQATTVDLTSGTSGSLVFGQSFNETRGVAVTVQGASDLGLTSMTLRGLTITSPSATVGARVYQNSTQALIASADVAVSTGSFQDVTVPITAVLTAGRTYRLCFTVITDPGSGSGIVFDPNPPGTGGFPYTESTGLLVVVQAYSTANDEFPNIQNIFVPRISAELFPGGVAVPQPALGASAWVLEPVRPNPVSESGEVDFELPQRSRVELDQFSAAGQRVQRYQAVLDQGRHTVPLFVRGVRPGLYFIRFDAYAETGELRFRTTRKFVVLGR